MSLDLRTAPRYFIVNGLPASISGFDASTVDLSVRGARIQLTQPLTVGSTLPMTIHAHLGAVTTKATVLWCRMAAIALDEDEQDRYLCGVAFDRPFPVVDSVIDHLLRQGEAILIADARTAERYHITTLMTATFGSGTVRVLDLSVGGARIGTAAPLPLGASAALRFRIHGHDQAIHVPATVVWSRPSARKGRFEAGLRVEAQEQVLRAIIDELSQRGEVQVDIHSLRRKFDALATTSAPGLVALL